jgi:hypothetical protein
MEYSSDLFRLIFALKRASVKLFSARNCVLREKVQNKPKLSLRGGNLEAETKGAV